jgi:hypothetical protein
MPTLEQLSQELAALQARVRALEDGQAIRDCLLRYLALCDRLDAHTPLDALGECFTEDACWAGKGARYSASFGGHQGRAAIVAMLAHYCGSAPAELPERAPHFSFNAHFLSNEQIEFTAPGQALARWQMLQTSSFSAGGSHPVSTWHSAAALPVPARSSTTSLLSA